MHKTISQSVFITWLSIVKCNHSCLFACIAVLLSLKDLTQGAEGSITMSPDDLNKYIAVLDHEEVYGRHFEPLQFFVVSYANAWSGTGRSTEEIVDRFEHLIQDYQSGRPKPKYWPGDYTTGSSPLVDWVTTSWEVFKVIPGASETKSQIDIGAKLTKSLFTSLYEGSGIGDMHREWMERDKPALMAAQYLQTHDRLEQNLHGVWNNQQAREVLRQLGMEGLVPLTWLASPHLSTKERLAQSQIAPDLRDMIADNLDREGNLTLTKEQVEYLKTTLFQELRGQISASYTDLLNEVTTMLKEQNADLKDYLNPLLAEQEREKRAGRSQQIQKDIEVFDSSTRLLGTIVGLDDPNLGQQITAIGSVMAGIATAVNAYQAAGALTASAINPALGALAAVVSLFGDQQNAVSNAEVLAAIDQVKQMIFELNKSMDARFDRVDTALNEIFKVMTEQFYAINFQLGLVQDELVDMSQQLIQSNARLNEFQGNMFSWLQTGFEQDFVEAVTRIPYRQLYGKPMPWDVYTELERRLYSWAVIFSTDDLRSGLKDRKYTDDGLAREFRSRPLLANLNFLNQLLTQRFGINLSGQSLANPWVWSTAANAYLNLAEEVPEFFFENTSSSPLEEIYLQGLRLRSALKKITLVGTSDSNQELFSAVVENYRSKLRLFARELQLSEKDFLRSLSTDARKQTALVNVDLWGGAYQNPGYQPPLMEMPVGTWAEASWPSLPLPKDWVRLVPPACLLAELVGAEQVKQLSWTGYGYGQRVQRDFQLSNKLWYRGDFADFQISVTVELSSGTASIWSFSTSGSQYPIPAQSFNGISQIGSWRPFRDGSVDHLQRNWDVHPSGLVFPVPIEGNLVSGMHLMDQFVTASSETRLPYHEIVVDQVVARLFELQSGAYQHTLKELSSAGGLHNAAEDLSGAMELLKAVVGLGFPLSVEADEVLKSLLYGNERIVDAAGAAALAVRGVAQVESRQSAKLDIGVEAERRINALETWLEDRLSTVADFGAPETLALIEGTLSRLEFFRLMKQNPVANPLVPKLKSVSPKSATPGEIFTAAVQLNRPYLTEGIVAEVDYGDGSPLDRIEVLGYDGFDLRHLYQEPGQYQITIAARDAGGRIKATVMELAVTNLSPVIATPILTYALTERRLRLAWPTVAGASYQLLSSVDLKTWLPLGPLRAGLGGIVTNEVSLTDPAMFYQVWRSR